ncbi:hypothetical protein MMC14_008474 [Varicellaria rhodocarpa]|nr:hypothetical protein [Varicellaria rhodocarpa]
MARKSNINSTEATFSIALLPDHPGKGHLGGKLDAFSHKGPNGLHTCVTFEPLGRSFETLLTKADLIQDDRYSNPTKYDPTVWSATFVREVCRQIILALDFLHVNRIMHRDIQPGNILLALNYNVHSMTETEIQQDLWEADDIRQDGEAQDMSDQLHVVNESLDPQWQKINLRRSFFSLNIMARLDGKPLHDGDPKYTVGPIPLPDRLTFDPPANFKCILNDLGSSCRFEDCNDGQIPYPVDVRSPQIHLGLPYDEKADIWALGVTLCRIVTLAPLIYADSTFGESDEEVRQETEDTNLINIIERVGPLPPDLQSHWANRDKHINASGELLHPDDVDPEETVSGDLHHVVRLARPLDMSDREAAVFESLIERMLQYDPGKRPSTTELLRHAWFTTEDFSRERHAAPPRRKYVVVRGGGSDTSSSSGTASLPGSPVMELPKES